MRKLIILSMLLVIVSCGQNNCSRSKRRTTRQKLREWRIVNSACSQTAYQERCTNVLDAEFKLVPQDFFNMYCYERYEACRANQGRFSWRR